jgi:hypothetical protein
MRIELIILIGVILLIILYFAHKFFFEKNKFENKKTNEDFKVITNNFENKKIIQYFGGDYCPFSNVNSNAYKIMKDFENEYGDKVTVNYYWSGKDNEIMKELKIEYVPTILNGNNDVIELKLPEDVDTTNLSNEELKSMLLENIYNKL